jgi:uncharacterized membrane protein
VKESKQQNSGYQHDGDAPTPRMKKNPSTTISHQNYKTSSVPGSFVFVLHLAPSRRSYEMKTAAIVGVACCCAAGIVLAVWISRKKENACLDSASAHEIRNLEKSMAANMMVGRLCRAFQTKLDFSKKGRHRFSVDWSPTESTWRAGGEAPNRCLAQGCIA